MEETLTSKACKEYMVEQNGNSRPVIAALEQNLSKVIRGKEWEIRLLLTSFLSGGHTLIEDVPGVGKTTLAKALAKSIDGVFKRIQFTPDLLPSDIIGANVFNPQTASFEFKKGPVFANILLADEVNRASPRTQSSLLEGMNERQVTVDGVKYPLPEVFSTIATQNPIEYHGTYPLPEAQLDRFTLRLELGYPAPETEVSIVMEHTVLHSLETIEPVARLDEIQAEQEKIKHVNVDKAIAGYMIEIVSRTRNHESIKLGISPRGSMLLFRAIQAYACIQGRDYVIPDDVKSLLVPVCMHRIILDTKSRYAGVQRRDILETLLDEVPVPV